jgi:hypothetical protein
MDQPMSRFVRLVLAREVLSRSGMAKEASVAGTRDDGSGFYPFLYFNELFTVNVFPICDFNEKKERFIVFLF